MLATIGNGDKAISLFKAEILSPSSEGPQSIVGARKKNGMKSKKMKDFRYNKLNLDFSLFSFNGRSTVKLQDLKLRPRIIPGRKRNRLCTS